MTQLKDYFYIPGLAVIVKKGNETVYENYTGFADLGNKIALDSSTTISMASLPKMFTGVLIRRRIPDNGMMTEAYQNGKQD